MAANHNGRNSSLYPTAMFRESSAGRRITNRWTGATGSEFRIKRDPAQLLGSAVARSTQPFGVVPWTA